MLRGHIDALTTADFVEGWAFDDTDRRPALHVEIVSAAEGLVAEGHAHLFRPDLADVRFGLGWCAFRLRLRGEAALLRRQRLLLRDADTGTVLHEVAECRIRDDLDPPCASVEEVIAADPFVLTSMAQLRACEAILGGFVTRRGVGEFVCAAYVYVLGRPVDATALATYGRLLRTGMIAPLGLLSVLAESEEFRARPRRLASPNATSFVFRS